MHVSAALNDSRRLTSDARENIGGSLAGTALKRLGATLEGPSASLSLLLLLPLLMLKHTIAAILQQKTIQPSRW